MNKRGIFLENFAVEGSRRLDFQEIWIPISSTLILKPSLHGFEFRFHKKVSNGYRSATKGLGSLLKADKGHSQVWKFVLVCCRVTSTSRHALGKENTVLTRCLKILTNIPKYETLMRQNPRRPLPAKASRVSKFPSALNAPPLIY